MDLLERLSRLEEQIKAAGNAATTLEDIAGYAAEDMLGTYERYICTAAGTQELADQLTATLDDMTKVVEAVKSLVTGLQLVTKDVIK